ncbi:MAG: hypothetical protein GX922_07120 [Firmicutes bacterium]|mgnify:CR=1 FL=1|jgi:succinyl-CoA synthetase beta subunit|nr:hypothetical protein [Bacillota bacterium]
MKLSRHESKKKKAAKLLAVTPGNANAEVQQKLKMVVQEWQVAVNLFNEATEKSVIDEAIKAMGEAEKKYAEIISWARLNGCRVPVTIDGYEERRKLLCPNWN